MAHFTALVALATICFSMPPPEQSGAVVAEWSPEAAMLSPLETAAPAELQVPFDGGAARRSPIELAESQDFNVPLTAPSGSYVSVPDRMGDIPASDELLARVGGQKAGGGKVRDQARGTGSGSGIGSQQVPGFFGVHALGTKFVYVVDCSNSMNAPHSESRSRFQRLKLELVRSIGELSPDMQFFVIFFSSESHPMPADELQYATLENKRTYLQWVVKMRPGGGTDPELSIKQALSLRPDVIYLLTDGSFDRKIGKRMLKSNVHRVAVHTFGFGNQAAEDILRGIAEQNRGLYSFVP